MPMRTGPPLMVGAIALRAETVTWNIDSSSISWGDQKFTMDGSVTIAKETAVTDLNIKTDLIVDERLAEMIFDLKPPDKESGKPSSFWNLPVRGSIKVSSNRLIIKKYAVEPFSIDAFLGPRMVRLTFTSFFILRGSGPRDNAHHASRLWFPFLGIL